MKQKLPKLCFAALAMTMAMPAFSQTPENVTHKLENPSFEYATANWEIELLPNADNVVQMWSKQNKDQSRRPTYFGFHNTCLQAWRATSAANPVFIGDNGFSQVVSNLPNGTYVFGAYAVAADQAAELPNIDNVDGATIFANEDMLPIATENPEADTLRAITHARRFNVATIVDDGTLRVGFKVREASVNYLAVDECSLYYFGEMDPVDALVAMSKIELEQTMAIADTCLNGKWVMNNDSLNLLQTAYDDAKPYVAATMETTEQELEEKWTELRNRIMWANKSIADYRGLSNLLLDSDTLLMTEEDWFLLATEEGAVGRLNDSIALCRQIMEEHVANRDEINRGKAALREAMAAVRVFDLMNDLEVVLQEFLDTAGFSVDKDVAGKYSVRQRESLVTLQEEIQMSYDAYTGGEMTAVELVDYKARIPELIDQIIAMGKLEYNKFPIILNGKKDGFPYNVGEQNVEAKQVEWQSKPYMFNSEVKLLRFTVTGTNYNELHNNFPCWTVAEFAIFDKNGKQFDINADNAEILVTANATQAGDGVGSVTGLFDGDINNYYHTKWDANAPAEYHYIEVTLPEGEYDYTGFSFKFVSRPNNTTKLMPVAFEITSTLTQAMLDLKTALDNVVAVNEGTEPGYFNADLAAYNEAVANAKALLNNGGTDEEATAARVALEKAAEPFSPSKVNGPEPGKAYRIVSTVPAFFNVQNTMKCMVAHNDSVVWWEDAAADSLDQTFVFESLDTLVDNTPLYRIKNVATQKYMCTGPNSVMLREAPLEGESDSILVDFIGGEQFSLYIHNSGNGAMHTGDHNGGNVGTGEGAYGVGGQKGVTSGIVFYGGGYQNDGSSWYIREMQSLPLTTTLPVGKRSTLCNLYKGNNIYTFATKDACAFENFKLYAPNGEEIEFTDSRTANSITVVINKNVSSFAFAFDHSAEIEVTVSDEAPLALELQKVYDKAALVNPSVGPDVFQYADVSGYEAAMEKAEQLLEQGGSDEVMKATIDEVNAAVDALVPNKPDPEKEYFIINAYEGFMNHHMTPVAVFEMANINNPMWSFLQKNNINYRWTFTPVQPAATADTDAPVEEMYYIKNAASGNYFHDGDYVNFSAEPTSSYKLVQLKGSILAIDGKGRVHAQGHSAGAGELGSLVFYGGGWNTASAWRICEAENVVTDIDVTELAPEEEVLVKGVYDIFGRRVEAPVKGLYIVNGKKVIVK